MAIDDLTALYQQVESSLNGVLSVARAGGGSLSVSQRAQIERTLVRLSRDLERLDTATQDWAQDNVRTEFRDGTRQAQTTLGRAGLPSRPGVTRLEVQSLAALEGRISSDLASVRAAIAESLSLGNIHRGGVAAVERALENDGLVQWRRGEAKVQTPSGQFWNVRHYATMLGRTVVADARRESFRTRYLANGVDVVRVVANGTEHAVCAVWEGRALSLTGATPGLPSVDDARAAGLFHPQCTHRYVVSTGPGTPQPPLPVGIPTSPNPTEPLPILGRVPTSSRISQLRPRLSGSGS